MIRQGKQLKLWVTWALVLLVSSGSENRLKGLVLTKDDTETEFIMDAENPYQYFFMEMNTR